MLAMVVNDDAGHQVASVVWTFIASMLAPTVDGVQDFQRWRHACCCSGV
ncbi:hypothetical protein [Pseudomonas sp. SDO55104_S430]